MKARRLLITLTGDATEFWPKFEREFPRIARVLETVGTVVVSEIVLKRLMAISSTGPFSASFGIICNDEENCNCIAGRMRRQR